MTTRTYSALFLCTGNSARSILAEAILNRLGEERFRAYSAGSYPKGQVHPMALEVLRERGYDTPELRRTYLELERRLDLFTNLSIESLDRLSLQARLDAIGKTEPPAGGKD